MELRHIRYFMVLAKELHFRNASEKLFIAQSVLSRQLKELEKELGVDLFQRTKRRVELTEEGKHFLATADLLMSQLETEKNNLRKISKGYKGSLSIGHVGTAMFSVLPKFVIKFKREFPEVDVRLLELTNQAQLEMIQNGTLDAGFIRTPESIGDLKSFAVHSEGFSLVLPANHHLKNLRKQGLAVLKDESFILFARHWAPSYYDTIISICHRAGYTPKIEYETVNTNTMIQLVSNGLGVTILPSSIKNCNNSKLRFLNIDFVKAKSELELVFKEESGKNRVAKNFIQVVTDEY